MAQVPDREDAIRTLEWLKGFVNETWEKRDTITPLYEKREIKAKDILGLLPKTNCRECGLPTCFAFAMAIVKGQKRLGDCPALDKREFVEN